MDVSSRASSLASMILLGTGLVISARLLVAGAYRALWDALWYGDWIPSFLGIAVFIVLLPASHYLGYRSLMLALSFLGLVGTLSDNADALYLASSLVLPLGLRVASHLPGRWMAFSLGVGVMLDASLRLLAGGAVVFDHPHVRIIYGSLLLAGGLLGVLGRLRLPAPSWHSSRVIEGWGLRAALALLVLELGLAYPNALLRLAGAGSYTMGELAILAWLVGAFIVLGPRLPGAWLLLLPGGILAVLGGWGWIVGALAASLALGSALARPPPPIPWGFLLGGLLFILFTTAAIGVYAYPYLGLWPLADRLELVFSGALLLLLALSMLPRQGGGEGMSRGEEERGLWGERLEIIVLLLGGVLLAASSLLAPFLAPTLDTGGVGEDITGSMAVASYNIHQGFTADARYNAWDVVRVLNRINVTVACLQEVDAGRLTSAYIDMTLLLSLSGYHVVYQPAIESTYGVAIASVHPIIEAEGRLLPSTGEQRAALKATVEPRMTLVNAHLGLDAKERLMQARSLMDLALEEGEKAIVLCGDLNEEEGEALNLLGHYYQLLRPPAVTNYTCCLGPGGERSVIDYVGVLRGSGARILDYQAFYTTASDHLPVIAVVDTGGARG